MTAATNTVASKKRKKKSLSSTLAMNTHSAFTLDEALSVVSLSVSLLNSCLIQRELWC